MWSTVIARPGHGSHTVEERIDTRQGGTYLWCDCAGWKFAVAKGGCVHVKLAEAERAATPGLMKAEAFSQGAANRAQVEVDRLNKAALPTTPVVNHPRPTAVSGGSGLVLPIAPMLCQKVGAPTGKVRDDGVELADLKGATVAVHWPMLLRQDMAFEPKWDGHRMIVDARSQRVVLWSRPGPGKPGIDITDKYPEVAAAFATGQGVYDGEVIVLTPAGEHKFNALQNIKSLTPDQRQERVRFVMWDVLETGGEDVRGRPYSERRRMLENLYAYGSVFPDHRRVILTPSNRDGVALWNVVIERALEGLIAKPLSSTYKLGERGTWSKMKALVRSQMVVVAYTSGLSQEGTVVTPFGALILAEHDGKELRYAGKCGTGFTNTQVDKLLETLAPFEQPTPSVGAGVVVKIKTHVAGRRITWVRPAVGVTIEFQERGNDGIPRFPSFKGIASVNA